MIQFLHYSITQLNSEGTEYPIRPLLLKIYALDFAVMLSIITVGLSMICVYKSRALEADPAQI